MEGREPSKALPFSLRGLPMPWVVSTDICCPSSSGLGQGHDCGASGRWEASERGIFKQRPEQGWG